MNQDVSPLPEDAGPLPPPAPPLPARRSFKLPTAADVERIHQEAWTEGFREGQKQGREDGLAESELQRQSLRQRLDDLINHLSSALEQVDQEMAEELLDFAVELARQIAGHGLQVQPESLLPVIREAMAALPLHHGTVLIHLCPEDMDMVREHFGEQLSHAGWKLVEDKHVQRGGCKLHSGSSEIDATVATRWRRVLETIGARAEWLEPGS